MADIFDTLEVEAPAEDIFDRITADSDDALAVGAPFDPPPFVSSPDIISGEQAEREGLPPPDAPSLMRAVDAGAGFINRNVVDPILDPLGTVERGIEGIASLATGKNMKFLASPSEALRVPAISPETVKFFSPLGKTKEGTIAKGVEKFAGEFISGLTSPEMLFGLKAAKYYPELVGRIFQTQMATSIPAATETLWHSIRDRAETPDQVANALSVLAAAGMPVAIERGLRVRAAQEFQKRITPAEQLAAKVEANKELLPLTAKVVEETVKPATPEITPAESARVERIAATQPENDYVYHAVPGRVAAAVRTEGIQPGSWFAKTPEEALAFVKDDLNPVIFAVRKSEIKPMAADVNDVFGQEFQKLGIFERSGERHSPLSEVVKEGDRYYYKVREGIAPRPHLIAAAEVIKSSGDLGNSGIKQAWARIIRDATEDSVPINKPPPPAESEVTTTSGQAGVKPLSIEEAKPAGAQAVVRGEVKASETASDFVKQLDAYRPSEREVIQRTIESNEGNPSLDAWKREWVRVNQIRREATQPPAKPAAKEAVAPVAKIETSDPRLMSDEQLASETSNLNAAAKPFWDQLDAMGESAYAGRDARPIPEAQTLLDRIKPFSERKESLQRESQRRATELQNKAMYEAREKRVASAPVFQRANGWEIIKDGVDYVLRHPQSKEDVYRGKLSRVREVAKESQPEPEPARTTAGEGQAAETKLAQIVNDTIEQSTSPTKLGITPAGSAQPTDVVLGATDLKSVSPRAEARWQESVREKSSLLARLQDTAVNAWHSITREYADLPPREFPEQIDILRRLRASRNASARRTVDVLRGITHNLGPKQYGVFNRVVVLEDLLKDVESGKYADGRELPSGHANAAELTADLNKFKGIAEATPEIAAALARRGEFMNSLRETLVERGFLPETVLQDPRYFHHQVLMYLAATKSGGAKSFRDWFSGWQKARVGSSKAYNRQYVEAEGEVIADAFNKMTMQDLQGQMKGASDLTAELKSLHGDEWASHVPQNYTRWQPKRGNVFYPVKTVAERVMEEYLDGLRDILPEEFKDAVAIGRKREEWIIPKELAKVLDNLAPRKDTWIERLAGAGIGAWKRYILLNPLRAMKYQVNNTSGDVDFVFAANPRIFKEFKQAAIDSYGFHKKGKAATGDVKEAIDLGVVQSGWRASELPDIGGSEYFNWLTGSKPGITDRYWKWISKWNDAREDTARLATYRFALKEWDASKPFYGASVPKDVAALPTNKLKAAKVARELLIDYGQETEFGEFMRRKAVPFYRWMHGNFARYVQLVRNIPVQEGAGGARLASVGAKRAAAKGGALAVRGAFAYMAINLWNNLFFPDEEEALGDTRNQLYLILGRDEQGNIQTIRFQGALSDLLGWVGLENLPQDAEDLFKGKASLGDKMEEGFEAGVSRAVNATSPFYKTAAEAMTGRSLYPNALEPRPIRDKAEHIAGLFSLKNVYQWIAGKPHKPLRRELSGLLTYTIDPGEAAYNATRHMAAEWMEDRGEERSQTIPGKRANALYYYKQALRYKDTKLAAKFKAEYEAMGGKQEGLNASVQRSAPLASLGKKQSEFLKSLSPGEKAVVDRAQQWYRQVYRP